MSLANFLFIYEGNEPFTAYNFFSLFLFQYLSISSRDFPFVSGINFIVSHKAGAHNTANVQKVAAGPQLSLFSIKGVNWPTKKLAIQRDKVASDIARPLTAVGNISLIIIQLTGPKEKAKQAINNKMKVNIQGPSIIFS